MIETNRLSHSDIKKLDHFTKVTHYLKYRRIEHLKSWK